MRPGNPETLVFPGYAGMLLAAAQLASLGAAATPAIALAASVDRS